MDNEKGNPALQGGDKSRIEAADSNYSLPEEAREMLNAWLFAMRLRKYRQMKKLEEGNGPGQMTGVARDFHSSSPEDGTKVDEITGADAVAFEGDAGQEVAFVERDATEAGDTEFEDFGGVPAC